MITFDDFIKILKAMKLDAWGISVGSEILKNVPCKIFYSLQNEELKNAEGETVKVTAKIYFEGLYNIGMKDRLTFTDDFGVLHENIEILDVKPIKDMSGEILYTRVVI